MNNKQNNTLRVTRKDQRAALASPLRLEILGLFTNQEPLAIAEMAVLMGRTAGSLYHHVGILEKAGLLSRKGTRPKGKRHEALHLPSAQRIEFDTSQEGEDMVAQAVKAMAMAFRMAERDMEAALTHEQSRQEGSKRNLFATRMHLRASPKVLTKINKHLKAIEDLVMSESIQPTEPSPDDKHLSLTIALLPLKGRVNDTTNRGD